MMFGRGYNGMNGCFGNFGFMHGGFGMGFMLLIIILTVVAAVILINWYKKNQADDSAMEELKLRFIKGEITEEEFVKMKKLIEK